MKEVYTLEDLRAASDFGVVRLGVVGDPVAHSLSPAMQNAALAECGFPFRYARFQISPNELAEALQLFAAANFIGLNLTLPHKTAACSLVQELEPFAQQVGAINTIRFVNDRLEGANTDGRGFARAIRESFRRELADQRILVLGATGGAGRAIVAQCALDHCAELLLAGRDSAKLEALAHRWPQAHPVIVPWDDDSLGAAAAGSDLIVQATPLGLSPNDPSPIPPQAIAARHLVYDLNYQPSALLRAAAAAGAEHASGLTMLLHQGALAFEWWFDRPAPLAAMRAALGL